MEIHVHKLREIAIIFDQFSLIIEHWQNEERERDRATERVRGEEAEANSRLEREMQERDRLSGPPHRSLHDITV